MGNMFVLITRLKYDLNNISYFIFQVSIAESKALKL